jgi:hypothetical protein
MPHDISAMSFLPYYLRNAGAKVRRVRANELAGAFPEKVHGGFRKGYARSNAERSHRMKPGVRGLTGV